MLLSAIDTRGEQAKAGVMMHARIAISFSPAWQQSTNQAASQLDFKSLMVSVHSIARLAKIIT